jgi:hypothetical protein
MGEQYLYNVAPYYPQSAPPSYSPFPPYPPSSNPAYPPPY